MNTINIQRRKFLQKLALLAGGSSLFAQYGKLQLINSALAAPGTYGEIQDYKSLVCIYLYGGNDAFNMFVPMQRDAYSDYRELRQTLAVATGKLLPVDGVPYGFHPAMRATRGLYNQGRIALVSNVGNLVEPLTQQQYLDYVDETDKSVRVPPVLFSHSDQNDFGMTSYPTGDGSNVPTGWGGRLADLLAGTNSNPRVPLTLNISRTDNLWQTAVQTVKLSLNRRSGINDFDYLSDNWPAWETSRTQAWNRILEMQRTHAMEQQASENVQRTKRRIVNVQGALALSEDQIDTPYNSQNHLAEQLRMAARMIYARQHLGMKRQLFFVSADAYDTHGNQLSTHPALLSVLDEALNSFNQTLEELSNKGVAPIDTVTTFTSSEFGRTLGSNGDGTDHGWGGHHLVMGGAVDGGKVHGELPVLAADGPDDIGNAILPRQATDQYGATLAKWLDVADSDLTAIFPNLDNFPARELGFML